MINKPYSNLGNESQRAKVSIIVPIYNTEKYLEKCIKSIISQTYHNLEIILIDDGSTDQSLRVCNSFAQKDLRIRVVHQDNMGLSKTRNRGIKLATGSYITFFDSDDYIDPFMIETMLQTILLYQADICECGMYVYKVDGTKCSYASQEKNPIFINDLYHLIDAYTHGGIMIPVWNKLYKRSEIKDMLFDPSCVREEADYTLRLCLAEKKIVVISNPFYHYVKRESTSLTGQKISSKLFTLKNWGEDMRKQIMMLGSEYQRNADIVLYNSLVHVLKHFMRDYKKSLLSPNELQLEIHSVVNRLFELLLNTQDPMEFRDFDSVVKIIEELIVAGILKEELLGYFEPFWGMISLKDSNYGRKIVRG